ncbi:MAG: hypothetical protein RL398_795 [Planctomycetota bacterium]|jgi:predicted amidohydrolase YtcJ
MLAMPHLPHHTAGCPDCAPFLSDLIDAAGRGLDRRGFLAGAGTGFLALAVGGAVTSCGVGPDAAPAERIFYGGPILTMRADGERVEALAVRDGRIVAAGAWAEVAKLRGPATEVHDLGGKCLMPGFLDPHSHVSSQSAKFATVNLDPKPIGAAGSIADIQRLLREGMANRTPGPDGWLIGWGYDDTGIAERRHPTRDDLDAVTTEHPILLIHISSHLCTGNSRLLEVCGVTAATEDPEGGRVQRRAGGREPNGVFEENAMMLVFGRLPKTGPEQAMELLTKGLMHYAAAGITTAQDGAMTPGAGRLFAAMAEAGRMPIDVVGYPMAKLLDDAAFAAVADDLRRRGRFRFGGVKLVLDGSIQGYTAFLSKPYHVPRQGHEAHGDRCESAGAEEALLTGEASAVGGVAKSDAERGYASMRADEVEGWLRRCDAADVPILAHTNGDAATDLLLDAVRAVRGERLRPDLRSVIIHAQTMREDQLDAAAALGLVPSFFPIHVQFWGDRHRDLFLGPERAARINPAASALRRGMKFTLHHDAPIAGISMLQVVAAAVNRITSSGRLLGPEQRISAFAALRAITADAAWQYFEEDRKGTLEVGKLADLVILDRDPLAVPPTEIGDLRVLETVKEGRTIFAAG